MGWTRSCARAAVFMSSPCELPMSPILQLVSCHTLQIAFQYHGPVKYFSKTWVLLFYGLNIGLLAPARAVVWRDKQLQSKVGQGSGCCRHQPELELPVCKRSCPALCFPCGETQKSLTDMLVFVVFYAPLCLNLTTNALVSVGLGASQARVLKSVQSRLV